LLSEIISAVFSSWTRIVIALSISVVAAFLVGIYSGRSRTAEKIVIPILDVLQSVPILGFFPVAVFLLAEAIPIIGYEVASIFLLFTCTFWNLAFATYEAARSIPHTIIEVADLSDLPQRERLRKIYMPAAIPRIADQLPASLANAFYFLAASEVITLGEKEARVAGVGTLVMNYLTAGNYTGIALTLSVTAASIVAAYLLVLTPLLSYSDKYRFDVVKAEGGPARPAIYGLYTRALSIRIPLRGGFSQISALAQRATPIQLVNIRHMSADIKRAILFIAVIAALAFLSPRIYANIDDIILAVVSVAEAGVRLGLPNIGVALGFSVIRLLACLSVMLAVTVPLAYLVVEKPRTRALLLPALQIIASLPSPLIFPLISGLFTASNLTRELGAILLMLMGSIWYVFFSALSGFSRVHEEYLELSRLYRLSVLQRFRYIYLPFATPSLVTGLITASGGAWNTIIVAERLGEGGKIFEVNSPGLGKIMSELAEYGDLAALTFTLIVLTAFIVAMNRLLWHRLYEYSSKALRIHEQS